ncbi:Dynein regulatory complex subunit 4 [Neurospora sp. IMI 360204]|nr:Dynein regulatory complex subunit 4 [Neurospora sp. IMI 360204]
MDEQRKSEYESQSLQLRAELKQFEGEWAQKHDGKKPSREAIKQNPDIGIPSRLIFFDFSNRWSQTAQKYKQYNKLRDILSGKIPPPPLTSQRKRKQAETSLPSASTPSKRNKSAATPRSQHYSAVDHEAITPEVARKLFSPAVPSSIGPTPQKDGRVLGLFDLISHTPSKSTDDSKPRAPGFTATPSKRRHALDLENENDDNDEKDDKEFITPSIPRHRNLDRTPSSGRNRNLLDSFLGVRATNTSTPLNKNNGNSHSKSYLNKTPSGERSVSKLQFATPAFLRRTSAPLPPVDENGEWLDIEPLKLPRKPFSIAKGRGLSSVVASLRKMEEEKLDEELDMLREMEAMEQGEMGPPPPKKTVAPPREDTDNQKAGHAGTEGGAAEEEEANDFEEDEAALIEVEASFLESPSSKRKKERQRPVLLSGFDDENVYDSQDDGDLSKEGLDRNGQPLRVFKKKGQKRTTRKVNMRPTRTKRPSAPVAEEEDDDSEEEEEEDGDDVIPETQFDATKNNVAGDDSHNLDPLLSGGSGSEFDDDGSEGEGGEDEEAEASTTKAAKKKTPAKTKEKKKKDATTKKTKKKKNGGKEDGDEEPVKKPRMVKATANANFKRLKLKNNGAKGGPAHNSRFRRRR